MSPELKRKYKKQPQKIIYYVQKHNATNTADFLSEIMKVVGNGMMSSK